MLVGLRSAARYGSVFRSLRLTRSSSTAVQTGIRDAFRDIENSLSLVNQGDRLETAQKEARQLEKELEVCVE